jgi:hypothetical protein
MPNEYENQDTLTTIKVLLVSILGILLIVSIYKVSSYQLENSDRIKFLDPKKLPEILEKYKIRSIK